MSELVKLKTTKHAKYHIAYHFVWIPKYRKEVLTDDIKDFLVQTFKDIAKEYNFEIITLEIMPDYIHLLVSAPPKYSPSTLVKILKGISAKKLLLNFPELHREYWKKHLWAPSYFVGTAGQITEEVITRYIEACQKL
jgi:putative transposase